MATYEAVRIGGGKVHLRYACGGPCFCGGDVNATRGRSRVTVVKGGVFEDRLCRKCFGNVSSTVMGEAGITVVEKHEDRRKA